MERGACRVQRDGAPSFEQCAPVNCRTPKRPCHRRCRRRGGGALSLLHSMIGKRSGLVQGET